VRGTARCAEICITRVEPMAIRCGRKSQFTPQ
jgi:hypothetical protein